MFKIYRPDICTTIQFKYLKYFENIFGIENISHKFHRAGYQLCLVGGCLRDLLLGKEPHDVDLCTNATPEQMKNIPGLHTWASGEKHGTLTVSLDSDHDHSYEITTFRGETTYTDHRHPDEVKFGVSLEEDLKRRDLTINSFAYDLTTEELIMLEEDYVQDLELGIIRAVGDPKERFKEDALRMLRTIRFAAQFAFTIEEETFNAIKELSSTLQYISKERIRDELTKILLSDHPEMLDYLYLTGLDTYTLPFLKLLIETKQNNIHHYTDALHHTYDVIRSVPKDFCLRWGALLHDIGKPVAEQTDEKGYDHYIGHPEYSAYFAKQLMQKLKFDNKSIDEIYTLVLYHDSEIGDVKMSKFKKLITNIGIDLFDKFLTLRYADAMAHRLHGDEIKDIKFVRAVSKAKERFKAILKTKDALTIKDLTVNGYDMINLGLSGKQIGETLNTLLEHVLEVPEDNNKEFLINYTKEHCIIK